VIWLLDTGPLGLLALNFDLEEEREWPAETLHVTSHVVEEAQHHAKVSQFLQREGANGPCVRVHEITARSPAGQRLAEIRGDAATARKNLGEDASVALCLTDLPDAILVTDDNRSAFMALQELGRTRVSTSYDLWLSLLADSHISLAVAGSLCDATRRKLNNRTMPARIVHALGSLHQRAPR
jgi:hypothetical protein